MNNCYCDKGLHLDLKNTEEGHIMQTRMGIRGMFYVGFIMENSDKWNKRYLSGLMVSRGFSGPFFISHGTSLRTSRDEDGLISLAWNNSFSLGPWELNEAITSFDFFGWEERMFGSVPRRLFCACITLCDGVDVWLAGTALSRKHPAGCSWTAGLIVWGCFRCDEGDLRWFVFVHFPQMLLFEALRIWVRLSRTVKLFGESVYAK